MWQQMQLPRIIPKNNPNLLRLIFFIYICVKLSFLCITTQLNSTFSADCGKIADQICNWHPCQTALCSFCHIEICQNIYLVFVESGLLDSRQKNI